MGDTLPISTTFVSCSATGGGICEGTDNNRAVSFPTLAAGDSASVTLVTTVSDLVTGGTPITDRAVVTSSTPDPSAANDSAAVSVLVQEAQAPDIILILTDDQPRHTMDLMPQVNALIGDQGVRFTNYYVSTPICGASRANILSGRYSHHTHVFGNGNAADRFDDSVSLATWLHGAGYKTALVGKYFNNYDEISPYVPPGWDDWRVFLQTLYFDYDLNENGTIVHYGSTPADYSTTVLANHAVQIIQQTPTNQPLFLEVATWAPHTPATPEPSDVGAMAGLPLYAPPSFNEADVSDKPLWVRDLPLLTPQKVQNFTQFHEDEGETLLAVDRAVADIVNALAQAGRLQNAVLIFTSDNGWSNGVHRWERKLCPYEECAAQPLLIRAPGLTPRNEAALASNIDLAPTIAEFAGIAPGGPVNGISLVPLLQNPATPWRDAILLENLSGAEANMNYYAIRDPRYLYTEYANGDRELYDLQNDPFELDNAYDNPAYASVIAALQTRLQQLKAD
jgi:arylsulfatase A-like enzyme